MVSSEGSVWGWGSNTEGQLGLGEHGEETVHSPTRLPFSQKVTQQTLPQKYVIKEWQKVFVYVYLPRPRPLNTGFWQIFSLFLNLIGISK